jgi:hypothetical protein
MKIANRWIGLMTGAALTLATGTAQAIPITWALSGVTFSDGGTASGSFRYDADTDTMLDVMITTTAGTARSGTSYTQPFNGLGVNDDISTFLDSLAADLTGATIMQLAYADPLTNAGGTIVIQPFSDEGTCYNAGCTGKAPPIRQVTSGFVTTEVSEPTTLATLCLGLAALGFTRRRMKA